MQVVMEILEQNGLAGEFPSQFFSTGKGSVGDQHTVNTVVHKMFGRQLTHLSCPDQHDGLALNGTEDFTCQFHSRKRH